MQSIWKNSIRCLLFVLVLILLLVGLSPLFTPDYSIRNCSRTVYRFSGVYGEPENTIDVLLAGDSESFSSFSSMELWKDYGITSYQCSTPLQDQLETLEYAGTILETQKPRVLVLETLQLFRECKWEDYFHSQVRHWLPIFENHDVWTELPQAASGEKNHVRYIDDTKGYYIYFEHEPLEGDGEMIPTDEVEPIPDSALWAFQKILKFCRQENMQLLLVSSPSTVNWNYARHNAVEQLSRQYGVPYLDMNLHLEQIGIDWSIHTRDKGDHLNHAGAVLASRYLGSWLLENGELEDHRQDPAYSHWEDSLKRYEEMVSQGIVNKEPEFRPVPGDAD